MSDISFRSRSRSRPSTPEGRSRSSSSLSEGHRSKSPQRDFDFPELTGTSRRISVTLDKSLKTKFEILAAGKHLSNADRAELLKHSATVESHLAQVPVLDERLQGLTDSRNRAQVTISESEVKTEYELWLNTLNLTTILRVLIQKDDPADEPKKERLLGVMETLISAGIKTKLSHLRETQLQKIGIRRPTADMPSYKKAPLSKECTFDNVTQEHTPEIFGKQLRSDVSEHLREAQLLKIGIRRTAAADMSSYKKAALSKECTFDNMTQEHTPEIYTTS
ncbi:unnamed protein product [Auanema sp. JU1783]|nr:unnamed protein product [Auanema sp. JU1783]